MSSTGGAAEFWGIEYATVLPPGPPRWRRGVLAAVGGLGLVTALGAGSVAYAALSGGGPQPESQVPARVLAYAEVDLDPPAGEKVDLLRLVSRFPRVDGTGDDLRAALLRSPLAAAGADYD
ncbi:MAG: hypothetical protein M3P95_07025, partial [Actinomycetota bacterium]|nr:hypothetical protein [Actinomycetota bacterium]